MITHAKHFKKIVSYMSRPKELTKTYCQEHKRDQKRINIPVKKEIRMI